MGIASKGVLYDEGNYLATAHYSQDSFGARMLGFDTYREWPPCYDGGVFSPRNFLLFHHGTLFLHYLSKPHHFAVRI